MNPERHYGWSGGADDQVKVRGLYEQKQVRPAKPGRSPNPHRFAPGTRAGSEVFSDREKNGPCCSGQMPPGGNRIFVLPVRVADPGPELS